MFFLSFLLIESDFTRMDFFQGFQFTRFQQLIIATACTVEIAGMSLFSDKHYHRPLQSSLRNIILWHLQQLMEENHILQTNESIRRTRRVKITMGQLNIAGRYKAQHDTLADKQVSRIDITVRRPEWRQVTIDCR